MVKNLGVWKYFIMLLSIKLLFSWYSNYHRFLFKNIIYLIGGYLFYNIVMVFALHQHELARSIQVSPASGSPSHRPPHPTPPGCHRAPALALGFLCHTSDSHWLSILHMVTYIFQYCSLNYYIFVQQEILQIRPVLLVFVVVQLPSHVWLFAIPWTAARHTSLSFTISHVCPCSHSLSHAQWT